MDSRGRAGTVGERGGEMRERPGGAGTRQSAGHNLDGSRLRAAVFVMWTAL